MNAPLHRTTFETSRLLEFFTENLRARGEDLEDAAECYRRHADLVAAATLLHRLFMASYPFLLRRHQATGA